MFVLRPVLDLGAPGVLPLTQCPWLLLLGPVTGVFMPLLAIGALTGALVGPADRPHWGSATA